MISIKQRELKLNDGHTHKCIVLIPTTPQDTKAIINHKEELKKYGAFFSNINKLWYWMIDGKSKAQINDLIETKIKPVSELIVNIEQGGNSDNKRDYIAVIDELIQQIESSLNGGSEVENATSKEVKDKLLRFKQELVNIVNDKEFKEKLGPIIRFRQAQGHKYSLNNSILIFIQDPEATMVKSRKKWADFNKIVMDDAPAIALWKPTGTKKVMTPAEQKAYTKSFLAIRNVKSIDELNPGDKDILKTEINKVEATGFKLVPDFYDVRFTVQMDGKEDLVGNPKHDLPWYDNTSEETSETAMLVDAGIMAAQSLGIQINYVQDLGGARGVSKSGVIELLDNEPKNPGFANTLFHEFSHELLHQKYLKGKNSDLSDYFVGTNEGRGKVEQQAELSAWIIMRNYGYDMPTNINYVGIWGMDEKSAPFVFDQVANVASYIINITGEALNNLDNNMQESIKMKINETVNLSGEEVANMIGLGDVYKRGLQKQQEENQIQMESIKKQFYETLDKLNNPLKGYDK